VCTIYEYDYKGAPMVAKWEAENIAAALNLRASYNLEKIPKSMDELI